MLLSLDDLPEKKDALGEFRRRHAEPDAFSRQVSRSTDEHWPFLYLLVGWIPSLLGALSERYKRSDSAACAKEVISSSST